jgi:hypothetical protein
MTQALTEWQQSLTKRILFNGRQSYCYIQMSSKHQNIQDYIVYGRSIEKLQPSFSESDRFLYVMSGKLTLSWRDFKALYDQLNLVRQQDLKFNRFNFLRTLQSLGHCDADFSDGKGTIFVAPPTLVRLPWRGLPTAVLCGARTPTTVGKMQDVCDRLNLAIENIRVTEQAERDRLTPTRITVVAEAVGEIQALARETDIFFDTTPGSQAIMAIAASVNDYKGTLSWNTETELAWEQTTFNTKTFQFKPEKSSQVVRFVRYTNPQRRNHFLHLLWNGDRCTEVELDFGRYMALDEDNEQVLVFDPKRHVFAHPATVPLPPLMARALTLCSGWAPCVRQFENRHDKWLMFEMVPYSVARAIASKLGQDMIIAELKAATEQIARRAQEETTTTVNIQCGATQADGSQTEGHAAENSVRWLYEFSPGDDEYVCASQLLVDEKFRPVKKPEWIMHMIDRARSDHRSVLYLLGPIEHMIEECGAEVLLVIPSVFGRSLRLFGTELSRHSAKAKFVGEDMRWKPEGKGIIDGTELLFGLANWRDTPPMKIRNSGQIIGKHIFLLDAVFDSMAIPHSYANHLTHIGAAQVTYLSILKTLSTITFLQYMADACNWPQHVRAQAGLS